MTDTVLHRAPSPSPRHEVRVLSVPASHVYVRHLADPDGPDGVVRLSDPVVDPGNPAASWWPPPALDPRWLREHADTFDLVHVQFGFDARSPEELRAWAATLRDLGKPLIYTAHDLRNPHHPDTDLHHRQLAVLMASAARVVTLTRGAAEEIRGRWGVDPVVLPHPHVVPLPLLERPRPGRDHQVVGLHLKSVRANMAPLPVLDALVEATAGEPGVVLRVDLHHDVVRPDGARHDPELVATLRAHEAAGRLRLHVHDYFTDAELWDYLEGLDLSVLPYRFGTHSGWLEGCFDLGTTVVAPDCGHYADQRRCLVYHHDDDGLDHGSLREAVVRGVRERPRWRATRQARLQERRRLARAHRQLYDEVTGRGWG